MKKTNEGQLIAKTRDKFFRENPTLLEMYGLGGGTKQGQYLKNRLEKAFMAGWDAARKQEKK